MLNPLSASHRARLERAIDHAHQQLAKYHRARSNTVKAYLGESPHLEALGWGATSKKYLESLPQGNLLQVAGLSHQITLAYGNPAYLCTPMVPGRQGLADELQPALNRMANLLNLGETAREVAADSFFGYGIFKTGVGELPQSAQVATGLTVGPCVWRVSQASFLYDIEAADWDSCSYQGDMYSMGLEDAQARFPGHEDRLAAMLDTDRLDAPHILARPSHFHSAEETVWLMDVYFPAARLVATWPIRSGTFGEIAMSPLEVREYDGHWSGMYTVLNHLYCPDELVPIAQAESVKAIHYLFNDLMRLTADQARRAKVHPIYQQGSEKDMRRIWDAADRHPVSVQDVQQFGQFEIPGPSQAQTAYMGYTFNLFKELVPTVDEPQRAPTATQGALERQTTNAIVAESKRKFNRALQLVGYQLGHLLMRQQDLVLPMERPLMPGSEIMLDSTWDGMQPREGKIDDFELRIEPHSLLFRTPEEKLQLLQGAAQQVAQFMQLRATGAPINVQEVIETYAEYSGLPELRTWFEELLPEEQVQRAAGHSSVPRLGVGNYTRHNVSEQTTAGQLNAALQGITDGGGEGGLTEAA